MGSSTDSGFFRLVTNRTAYAAILIFLIFDKRQICAIEIDQPVSDAKDSLTDADSAYDSFLRISSRKIAESGDDFFLNASLSMISRLNLVTNDESINDPSVDCDPTAKNNPKFKRYFDGMSTIYQGEARKTCLVQHMKCGWPAVPAVGKKLPLLVVSVGLEGAGHHLWTEILKGPVFDCVWTNARHYRRDVADGVPRLTAEELHEGIQTQFNLRAAAGEPACRKIYDAEDSFPTGSIRKSGRLFCRPDLVNVQKLDGILYDVKYLVIARNVTDTALSALRRNFFFDINTELRTVEHTLTYLESALKGVPCHRVFIAHYEHVQIDPSAYIAPLSSFLELNDTYAITALASRLSKKSKIPSRKQHKLTQYSECKSAGFGSSIENCSNLVTGMLERFFIDRKFMWPTFAGNGFNFVLQHR